MTRESMLGIADEPTCEELAAQLKVDYEAAGSDSPLGIDKVSAVLLFAERNAKWLNRSNLSKIVKMSGLPEKSYKAWLHAGLRLALARERLASRQPDKEQP